MVAGTDTDELDSLLRDWWTLASGSGGEDLALAVIKMKEKYPALVLMEELVYIWQAIDFNVFHYGLRSAATMYAITVWIERGHTLTPGMIVEIDSFRAWFAYEPVETYLVERGISASLEVPAGTYPLEDIFPEVPALYPDALSEKIRAVIEEECFKQGRPSVVPEIETRLAWYRAFFVL